MKIKPIKDRIGFRINRDTKRKLIKLSEENQRRLSDYCRLVLENHIEEMEEK